MVRVASAIKQAMKDKLPKQREEQLPGHISFQVLEDLGLAKLIKDETIVSYLKKNLDFKFEIAQDTFIFEPLHKRPDGSFYVGGLLSELDNKALGRGIELRLNPF